VQRVGIYNPACFLVADPGCRRILMLKYGVVFLFALVTIPAAPAANWPQWRGPHFNGSTDERNLPAQWSQTENVAWVAELPGVAAATPIIWEDRVLLSGVDSAKDSLQAQCFDRTTGKLLWSHDVAQGIRKDERSNFASGSPATDGRLAVFFYGNGDVIAFDLDGRRRWSRNIQQDYGTFAFLWTFSSSPLLWNGKLYLQVLQRDVPVEGRGFTDRENESYLLALEPETGRTLWRQVRPSPAVAESREAFSTPIPYQQADRSQLLVAGGDVLTGHDPATGAELWRWGTWNPQRIPHWRLVVSPVAGAGVVLACAPKRDPVYALRADGSGTLDDRALAWVSREAKEVSTDVPTPAFYDGDFFVLSDVRKSLSRVGPRTGKVKWTVATPGRAKYEASPLAADGKLYLINFDGAVAVLSADTGALLRVIPMDAPQPGEVVRASISAAHGHLFIRTTRKLYCIGPR
jgi:outer membrane protein assembly factor BamB